MQAALAREENPTQVVITVEAVAIILLICISLSLRLLSLNTPPLAETETAQALSAWRFVRPEVPGDPIIASSPVIFWSQVVSFGLTGGGEFGSRLFTALAGVLLSLSPLLFRGLLGRSRAYIFALALTFSPVLMAASRLSAGAVWAMLFAILGMWLLWRYWETGRSLFAYVTMVMAGALVFLSEPGGPMLALILLGATVLTLYLSALDAPHRNDLPGDDFLLMVRERFNTWPWLPGIGLAALVVVAVSTVFLVSPDGLSMVAEVLGQFVTGFSQPSVPDAPLFFPLLVSLFYEFGVWVVAIVAVIFMIRSDNVHFVDRFFLAWVIVAGVASLVYQGAGAAHALWLIIPLTGLASHIFSDAMLVNAVPTLWIGDFLDDEDDGGRGKWILAFVVFCLLVMLSVHVQVISRSLLTSVDFGTYLDQVSGCIFPSGEGCNAAFVEERNSFIWLIVTIVFIFIGFLMAASIWGNVTAGRGIAIGIFAFILLSGLATGWNLTVDNYDNPTELWYVTTPSRDAPLLRDTVLELASRETQGFPQLPIAVVAEDDGLIAWLVRDFTNAVFVDDVAEARTEQVVIAPETQEAPDLGGSYVGQRFVIDKIWRSNTLVSMDILPWWVVREARVAPAPYETVILWVRQDIFNSQPFD